MTQSIKPNTIKEQVKHIHATQQRIKTITDTLPGEKINLHDLHGKKNSDAVWLHLDMPLFYKEEVATTIQWKTDLKNSPLQKHAGIHTTYSITMDILFDKEIAGIIQEYNKKSGSTGSCESLFYFDELGNAAKYIDVYEDLPIPKTSVLPDIPIYKSEVCLEDLKYITRGLEVMLERLRDYERVCGDARN